MPPFPQFSIVGLLSALCLSSGPGMASDDSERLTFAWPDGLSGRVSFALRQVGSSESVADTVWEGGGAARFAVSRDGSATVVTYSDEEFELVANQGSEDTEFINEILAPAILRWPGVRIGAQGQFLGLDQRAEFLAAINDGIDAHMERLTPEQADPLRMAVEQSSNALQIEYMARTRWEQAVGRWVGREVRTGKPNFTDDTLNLPFDDETGGEVPSRVSYALVGRRACGDAGPQGCVELEFRTLVDGPAATAAYDRLFSGREPGGDSPGIVDFRLSVTTRVVTDPQTLIPYSVQSAWDQSMALALYGDPIVLRQSGESTITYIYD